MAPLEYGGAHLPFKKKGVGSPCSIGYWGVAHYYYANKPTEAKKNKYFRVENLVDLEKNPVNIGGTIETTWNLPDSQKIAQALYIAQAIQICAALLFGENRRYSLLQLAGLAISLYQSSRMKWIEISHQSQAHYNYTNSLATLQPTIAYHALLAPSNASTPETCVYCLDEVLLDSYYCSNKHRYHTSCLVKHFTSNVEKLASSLFNSNRFTATVKTRNGTYAGTTFTYTYNENELPSCPQCRERASHAFLSFNWRET